ncbi:unnamed protein product [Angiostrongylus costaricensis]|uniref:Thioredoxin domain-containing protein n=1 Tax=Angiostrongylus costaricensis TaxID=334426 RepID=A0A0R3Q1P3_ANGCS|nr:unnamed protein product [Angiostrongylus costaricensis]
MNDLGDCGTMRVDDLERLDNNIFEEFIDVEVLTVGGEEGKRMKLGDTFPAFSAVTNLGKIEDFHDWMGNRWDCACYYLKISTAILLASFLSDSGVYILSVSLPLQWSFSWAILFSHPADFTPVCTTELARAVQLAEKFEERQVQMIALSCDSAESHRSWIRDILAYAEVPHITINNFPFEIIADEDRRLATELGMLDPAEKDSAGIPLTARAVFIIDPKKKLRAQILYPATTGRNFDEILRIIDSLQLTDRMPVSHCFPLRSLLEFLQDYICEVATPEGWNSAKEACMVQPSVSMSEAEELFEEVDTVPLPSGKPYLRRVHIIE